MPCSHLTPPRCLTVGRHGHRDVVIAVSAHVDSQQWRRERRRRRQVLPGTSASPVGSSTRTRLPVGVGRCDGVVLRATDPGPTREPVPRNRRHDFIPQEHGVPLVVRKVSLSL